MNPVFLYFVGLILFLVAIVFWGMKLQKDGKKELINELWTNGKISDTVYKEYLKKLD